MEPLDAAVAPRAGAGARIAAGVGGLAALLVAAVVTAGSALVAPIGMLVSRAVVRARGRRPGLLTSWLGAVIAAAVAIAIVFGVFIGRQPRLYDHFRQTVDSVATASAQRNAARGSPLGPGATRAFAIYGGAAGALLSVGFMGLFAGTLGWAASLPLAFAITGRWREPAPVEPLAPDA